MTVERPKNRDHGDYATNVALQLAKAAGMPPRALAELLAARLREVAGIAGVDVAGPGFLNITLAAGAAAELAREHRRGGRRVRPQRDLRRADVNLEFVSANPTGPLHLGHTRWAAVGDALGRLLEAAGAEVRREYYINDAGAQIEEVRRVAARCGAHGGAVPRGRVRRGAYIEDIAAGDPRGRTRS